MMGYVDEKKNLHPKNKPNKLPPRNQLTKPIRKLT